MDKLASKLAEHLSDGVSQARLAFLTAFVGLLGEVAYADMDTSDIEMKEIERIVGEIDGLQAEEARALVALLANDQLYKDGKYRHTYLRTLAESASRSERMSIMQALFQVAAADDALDNNEEHELRQIADGMRLSREDFIEVRNQFKKNRTVLKGM